MSFPDKFNSGNNDLFRVLMELFSDPQKLQWELASQLASISSSADSPDTNIDPVIRSKFEEVFGASQALVLANGQYLVGSPSVATPELVTPQQWAQATLQDWRDILTNVASTHSQPFSFEPAQMESAETPIDVASMFGQAAQALGPALFGMQIGSSIGNLARSSFGNYDIPIPRGPHGQLRFVVPNIEKFANDWSLPFEDLSLWVCTHEIIVASLLDLVHVRQAIKEALREYAENYSPDAQALQERLSSIDIGDLTDISQMQSLFADPSLVTSTGLTPGQVQAMERSSALFSAITGYSGYCTDRICTHLLGSPGLLSEAFHRSRVEREGDLDYLDNFLGMETGQDQVDLGRSFIRGVLERSDESKLLDLWKDADHLPTPPELEAPGLWIERVSFLG